MTIKSEINKSLKIAKIGENNLGIEGILYPLSGEYNEEYIPGPASIYDEYKNLIKYVERTYLDKPEFDSSELINDLNQFKAMKYNLEIEIQKKHYLESVKGLEKVNDEKLYYNLNIVNSIVYTLESLKEEFYLKRD